MINLFNKWVWPFALGAGIIFTATVVFAGVSRYTSDVEFIDKHSKDTCILNTEADSIAYIQEHIDQNMNGMPDDLENGTDTIYQIILDNQQSIEEITVQLDRINIKLDELSKSRQATATN